MEVFFDIFSLPVAKVELNFTSKFLEEVPEEYLDPFCENISTNKHLKELSLAIDRQSLKFRYLDLKTPNLEDVEKVRK